MKHNTQAAPPYSEAQTTAWLAWLARGMQRHGQTIFLIEQLQPSWLTTRMQRRVYLLTTRLLWGIIIGLISELLFELLSVLISRPTSELLSGLLSGLLFGLIFGFIFGLMDIVRTSRGRSQSELNAASGLQRFIRGVMPIILIMLISTLIYMLTSALRVGRAFGLRNGLLFIETVIFVLIDGALVPPRGYFLGLIFGLIGGPFWTLRSFGRHFGDEIQTIESIRFSLTYFPRGFKNGLLFGLIGELLFALISGWFESWINELILYDIFGPINTLILGLIVGLIVGLVNCIRPGIRELKTIPNQGIRLSVRSGCLMGGVGGLGLGLIVGLLGGPASGMVYGVLGGLCIGLWYGGLDVIQHYIVRALLVRQGVMPWDYARFLDYAAEELNFLQKVGGGYMFVHRYLLEYFAAMEVPGQSPGHQPE